MTALVASAVGVTMASRATLAGIDVRVDGGEFVAVVGPNGAGKTTLLRVLAGLLVPSRGMVTLDGVELSAFAQKDRARRIGYLAPARINVPKQFRVAEVLGLARFAHRSWWRTTGRADQSVAKALARFGLQRLAAMRLGDISDGERQRVWLASLDAQGGEVILVDEPTAHLDVRHVAETLDVLRAWARDGRAVVSVVHDLDAALASADRIIVLAEGHVVADGEVESVRPEVLAAPFGVALGQAVIRHRTRVVVADYEPPA